MELSITVSKEDDFPAWYTQLINKCKLIKYYDISGCYVLMPRSYRLWEQIYAFLDAQFKKRSVENAYFPLLITENNLQKEESHIEGFSAEVAWVTHTGDYTKKKNELDVKLAIRPTSETSIYSIYPDLIQGYQDLPLKINQWANVVRWEFKDAMPFIRSREFLWQEGHTCFETQKEAITEVEDIIALYQQVYREVLAVPTILGKKTLKEKFDGADETYTIEAFIPEAGKSIQAATAHYLGENFSKIFGITFHDENGENKYVHQNSWGLTTRSIGVMLMTHSDNKGLVLPPSIAQFKCVLIPIYFKGKEDEVNTYLTEIETELKDLPSYHVDRREYNPGWKYHDWEQQGVPLRVEMGPRDLQRGTVVLVRRDTGEKFTVNKGEVYAQVLTVLELIQKQMYLRADKRLKESLATPLNFEEFKTSIAQKKFCLIPWCDRTVCEVSIKAESGAKSLCKPSEKAYQIEWKDKQCIKCGEDAKTCCLFGRSY